MDLRDELNGLVENWEMWAVRYQIDGRGAEAVMCRDHARQLQAILNEEEA